MSGQVPAGRLEVDLHLLGWYGFQNLCLTVMRDVVGQSVRSFLPTRDGGRDGAWEGVWHHAEDLISPAVFQCKFFSEPRKPLRLSDISDELSKAKRLAADNRADVYVLMSNGTMTGEREETIESAFRAQGVQHFYYFGYTWFCDMIRDEKRLRMLVPRVYGLGDLSQIIDERAYAQTEALLTYLRDELAKVVPTESYRSATHSLERHNFVLLLGEPASGKSTIAALLCAAAVDRWGASVIKVDSAADLTTHWNPDEPNQMFWIDDAFGSTQYEHGHALEWNRIFPQMRTAVRSGLRIVMTSRDYIYRSARADLKGSTFPLLNESQVVIDVHELTLEEKRQILYNHLKLGAQPSEFRTAIKPFLEDVAANPSFLPELARRLGDPAFTGNLTKSKSGVHEFVTKPREFLREVIEGIGRDAQAALSLMFMRGGSLESPVDLHDIETEALDRLGSSLAGVLTALQALRGSIVDLVGRDSVTQWIFKHPTIADALADWYRAQPEFVDIYLSGASVLQLLRGVTCGTGLVQGALEVPPSRYPTVMQRFDEEVEDDDVWSLYSFLARRCDRDFLKMYVEAHRHVVERASRPGLYLEVVPEVPLALRLIELELMPEPARQRFISRIKEYAIEGQDSSVFSNARLRALLDNEELAALRTAIKTEFVPDAVSQVLEQLPWYSRGETSVQDRESEAAGVIDTLDTLISELAGDADAIAELESALEAVYEWIDEGSSDDEELGFDEYDFGEPVHSWRSIERSVFDDVDA